MRLRGAHPLDQFWVLPKVVPRGFIDIGHLFTATAAHLIASKHQVEQPAKHREEHDGHYPGYLVGGIAVPV